jgi:hypothetical protein
MMSLHDFRSPIGVTGVGTAVYGNLGISFCESQGSRPDYGQASQSEAVHKVLSADDRELQLDMSGIPSGPGDDVPESGGDFRIGQFVMGYVEDHDRTIARPPYENKKGTPITSVHWFFSPNGSVKWNRRDHNQIIGTTT